MRNEYRSGDAGAVVLRLFLLLAATLGGARVAAAQEPCAAFVHLEDGRFLEGNAPYVMEGPNFPMLVAAVEQHPGADPGWEYFLAPYDSFRPDGSSVCNGGSTASCCYSEATCRNDLQYDIDALVAMGANSVRLIAPFMRWHTSDPNHHTPYLLCTTASVPGANSHPCEMDLMDVYQRTRALDLIEEQINALGDRGIRSILLTGGPESGNASAKQEYGRWLEDLASRLVNNPYLIAYDPMNEPLYSFDLGASGYSCEVGEVPGVCKSVATKASKEWFNHLTGNDPNHLVTIGLGGAGSVLMWDPAILWDHFTSYHIYSNPAGRWADPGPGGPIGGPPFPAAADLVPGGRGIENDIYYGSLNACGVRCPYLGQDDGENCHVATGAVGAVGYLDAAHGGFDYPRFTTGAPCPVGTDTGTACQVATYDPGRDEPFILGQPLYYLHSVPGVPCPSGTTQDAHGCLAFTGPPNAQAFLYPVSPGVTGFYYNYLSPQHHCDAPAVDDTVHCYLGPAPAGSAPFLRQRSLYYVKPVVCGTRKPVHFGETGFSTHPYPTGSPDFWTTPPSNNVPQRLTDLHNQCNDVEGGPLIDSITVGGEAFEAEAGTLTNPLAMIRTVGQGTKGQVVALLAGEQLDVHRSDAGAGCGEITIKYQAHRDTRIWISMAGRAPRRVSLPSTGNSWVAFAVPLELPVGADTIAFTAPHDSANGDFREQAEFLTGDGADWPGVHPYGQACGFQGLHYWWYGSVTRWGACGDSAVNAPWWEVSLTSPPTTQAQSQRELRLTPAGETMRDQVDFLSFSGTKCEEPPHFRAWLDRASVPRADPSYPLYHYIGRVTEVNGTPMANVPVWTWLDDCGWGDVISTYTDRHGEYHFVTPLPVVYKAQASHFGYRTAEISRPSGSTNFPPIVLERITTPVTPTPPTPPTLACRGADGWVPQ